MEKMKRQLSQESYFQLGQVPIGMGAVLKGWHGGPSSVLDLRAMTEKCPHNCYHCFTNKNKKTLELREILKIIDQAAELGFKGVDFLGEGEPTIDSNFFQIIEYTSKRGIVPIVFTDAATKLREKNFVRKLYNSGASVCPKCDSLFNEEYQNQVVRDKTGKYFSQRNEAIRLLMKEGFNKSQKEGTTRLGFDMVVTKRNFMEVEQTLRYCRNNNMWVVFSTYLPAGRCKDKSFDNSLALSSEDLDKMRKDIQRIDNEYEFNHPIFNNFATFPCVEFMQIYGNGNVSPCPGNETLIGNIQKNTLEDLASKIINEFPCHKKENINGYCPYRY
jgi:MoaA/NifB/PqqE/SkfB family radical SAM enzyme